MNPTWLALFAPLPADAVVARKPVASPELAASGKVDAIAGWDSITVNLSDVATGMRHVMVAALRALVEDVIERAPARGEGERR